MTEEDILNAQISRHIMRSMNHPHLAMVLECPDPPPDYDSVAKTREGEGGDLPSYMEAVTIENHTTTSQDTNTNSK